MTEERTPENMLQRALSPDHGQMTREERRAWLAENAPRHDLASVLTRHIHQPSRPWSDGTRPSAPNWNPGCSCGLGMYYSSHSLHVAGAVIAALRADLDLAAAVLGGEVSRATRINVTDDTTEMLDVIRILRP